MKNELTRLETKVKKRNGTIIQYDGTKIKNAVKKAFDACDTQIPDSMLDVIENEVFKIIASGQAHEAIEIEQIQTAVLSVLKSFGFDTVYRAYKEYKHMHDAIRAQMDLSEAVYRTDDDFCSAAITDYTGEDGVEDWRVKQNASVTRSVGGLILSNNDKIVEKWWMRLLGDTIKEAHEKGDLHYHDAGFPGGYCAGWNLKKLIEEGLGGVEGKIASAPAKHLTTLVNQMVNFLGIMQNEWAGAQAFSSFDTYLAPFVKVDEMTYKEVKQCMQSFCFGINIPSRWGTQAPFSNITLDWTVPDDLKNLPAIVGGKEMDFTYGDCKEEMDMVNKAFLETMLEGDCNGRGFAYPIPTYSITKAFDWSDTENNRLLFSMAAKYGTPYFSNYVNSDMKPSDVRSMCCRLRLDIRELRRRNGGNFGAGENTGSIGVVTINMPRIAYLSGNEEDFFSRLEGKMDLAAKALDVRRTVCKKYFDMGLYPYTKRYLPQGYENHFSTIGLVGMNEACLNARWLEKDLNQPEAIAWTEKVLDFMREKLSDYQEQYGCLFNLEATPAESTCYRLARLDKKYYPDIITAGTQSSPYYTNSSHLPVGSTDDIFEALDKEDSLQTKYTSGTVFHAFLGEKLPDWKASAKLVRTIAENYRLPYYTLSPTYSVCQDHGYIDGEEYTCPICGKPTEVYSRITGYYRPVQNWNIGKAQEFKERKTYEIPGINKPESGCADGICGFEDVPETAGGCDNGFCSFDSEPAAEEISPDSVPEGKTQEKRTAAYLFTTPTCPNCHRLKAMGILDAISFTEVNAALPENRELVDRFNVCGAPTLVVVKNGTFENYASVSNIIGYVNGEK